jgi:hypothetical protein
LKWIILFIVFLFPDGNPLFSWDMYVGDDSIKFNLAHVVFDMYICRVSTNFSFGEKALAKTKLPDAPP